MKKRIISLVLAGIMTVSMSACMGQNAETPSESTPTEANKTETPELTDDAETEEATQEEEAVGLPPMTTENIKITYATWDDYEMAEYLCEKFTENYPNIETEVIRLPLDGYNDALLSYSSTGQLPDTFMYLHNIDMCISNGWFRDISEFWDNDPDTANYLSSLQNVGRIDGKRVFTMAAEYLPITVYLDKAVFDKLNVPMPGYDWKYNEMIDLMKSMTRPDLGIYSYNSYLGLVSISPVVNNDAIGEFGWNGSSYHFEGAWAQALNDEAEFRRLGYRALQGTEAWAAASGDIDMWPGNSGLVAMQHDAWWTMNNIYTKSEAIEKGIQMIPYVSPQGTNATTENKLSFIDMAAVSNGTDYPREAYELLKFIAWSKEGWMHRIDAFKTLTNETGEKMYEIPNCLPLVNDEEVWAKYRELYPAGEHYDEFFKHARNPVPLGGGGIPGFNAFLSEVYNNGDYNGHASVETAVIEGALDANDVAAELTKKGNEYYNNAMEVFYDVYGR